VLREEDMRHPLPLLALLVILLRHPTSRAPILREPVRLLAAIEAGTQFTWFTSTQVQILTQKTLPAMSLRHLSDESLKRLFKMLTRSPRVANSSIHSRTRRYAASFFLFFGTRRWPLCVDVHAPTLIALTH
jgi:hypothetical protein